MEACCDPDNDGPQHINTTHCNAVIYVEHVLCSPVLPSHSEISFGKYFLGKEQLTHSYAVIIGVFEYPGHDGNASFSPTAIEISHCEAVTCLEHVLLYRLTARQYFLVTSN